MKRKPSPKEICLPLGKRKCLSVVFFYGILHVVITIIIKTIKDCEFLLEVCTL